MQWRTVHIDGQEWRYSHGSKRRRWHGGGTTVIRGPGGQKHLLHDPEEVLGSFTGSLNPGRIKAYIERVILKRPEAIRQHNYLVAKKKQNLSNLCIVQDLRETKHGLGLHLVCGTCKKSFVTAEPLNMFFSVYREVVDVDADGDPTVAAAAVEHFRKYGLRQACPYCLDEESCDYLQV